MPKKVIVIFSHGFGIRSGSYGFFTDLIKELDTIGIQSILTEYCDFHPETNEVRVKPFSEQAKILQETIDSVVANNPESNIILLGQSQGATIISLCGTSKIDKIIMVAPFYYTDQEEVISRYSSDRGTTLHIDRPSYRKRTDGTTTVITPEYLHERFTTNIIDLYNQKALENKVYIFYGLQDQARQFTEHYKLKNIYLMNLDGDHDFSKQYRQPLIDKIKHIITL